jgi:omega-amidase
MKIYCFQMDIVWEDKKANFAKVKSALTEAKPPAGSLVVLPEMFATGFSMNIPALREDEKGETERFLADLARERGVFMMGGLVRDAGQDHGFNQSVTYSPEGELLGRYTKIQPFSLGGENEHYIAGDKVVLLDWNKFKVAPFVCYDLRFPEIFRVAARRGAHLQVIIANWPAKRAHHFVALARARAIENQCYVAALNRCGTDPYHEYNGQSMIFDPSGDALTQAGEQEGFISADLNLATIESLRQGLPFLKDMRDDYGKM